jgi:hypothetical protein
VAKQDLQGLQRDSDEKENNRAKYDVIKVYMAEALYLRLIYYILQLGY